MPRRRERVNIAKVLILSLALAGAYLVGMATGGRLGFYGTTVPASFHKFSEVLHLVDKAYVDEVQVDTLVEGAVEGLLSKLDPHSVYIPPKEQSQIAERFAGEFSGIGIQFEIRDNSILVVSPIPGTPADRLGLSAGDRIVEIDDVSTVGITNDEVFDRLRGPEGTEVKLTVVRPGEDKSFELVITRGRIPIHSIDAAFMLDDAKTGYVIINQFTSVTTRELESALDSLALLGMEQVVVDLRGNSGGYLGQADAVANLFLPGGMEIVSTEGRLLKERDALYSSNVITPMGNSYQEVPLIILVNRGSASASEIVGGAIQDNDRGLVLGQPTFGKGLVQSPFELDDGSVVRITTARWFTPSGRCVQKSWNQGLGEYYLKSHGIGDENEDTTATSDMESNQRIEYKTRTGRVVYANEGVTPDVEVDPGQLSEYGAKLVRSRVVIDWSRHLADSLIIPEMPFEEFRDSWQVSKPLEQQFIRYAEQEKDIEFDPEGWAEDREFLLNQIEAELAMRIYNGRQYMWQVLVTEDRQVREAMRRMDQADSLFHAPTVR